MLRVSKSIESSSFSNTDYESNWILVDSNAGIIFKISNSNNVSFSSDDYNLTVLTKYVSDNGAEIVNKYYNQLQIIFTSEINLLKIYFSSKLDLKLSYNFILAFLTQSQFRAEANDDYIILVDPEDRFTSIFIIPVILGLIFALLYTKRRRIDYD